MHHNSDIIFGSESKISPDFAEYSVFPEDYSVHRRDRNSEDGGVFIVIKETIVATSMPDINVNCEVIWAGWQFSDCKPLYIASYYGPHSNKQEALNEHTKSLSIIFHKQISNISNVIIGGHSIIDDINWDSMSTTKPSTATDRRYFLKILLENFLSQLVKIITRPLSNCILDLIATTNPNLVNNIETHTGISDHLVTFDICMKTKYQTKAQRNLFYFLKADTSNLKSKVLNFIQEFLNSNPIKNYVDTNWEIIQHNLCTIMDTTVPWKLSHKERLFEWISLRIKCSMQRRDKLYCRAR